MGSFLRPIGILALFLLLASPVRAQSRFPVEPRGNSAEPLPNRASTGEALPERALARGQLAIAARGAGDKRRLRARWEGVGFRRH